MRRRHLRRIERRTRDELARAIRRTRGRTGTLAITDGTALGITITIEPILGDRRHRWTWETRGAIGRPDCVVYSEAAYWNPAPLHYRGRSSSAEEARLDAYEVEQAIRRHYAELILEPDPITITTD